ncbi:proto-oncogene c-Rel-like isoform X1 [Salvelinus fontinalis]|uniref:proto-oncogene c-Rel-like isoform X1 n=1 Tax=Salvelinus fontinalis TaxID=8038 RepID=UPI0024852362|nr:proto-oncogene c-Rel-like isoform X1 [Salvelinus fontinalis]XP_055752394.1 proto-oncogene c-Rel-like isoform X1 [Salvelinus fontinalis]XP_055752395.1 proto-oncogene c-Rel-like isoform X1 [Salvelinus fontinalis]
MDHIQMANPPAQCLQPPSACLQSPSSHSVYFLDIIQEVISADREFPCQAQSRFCLPRPPHPPVDPEIQAQNHRAMPRHTPSLTPPVLVPRGTTSRPPCFLPQHHSSTRDMAAPHPTRGVSNRRGRGSSSSGTSRWPDSPSRQAQTDTDLLEQILERPNLAVVEQPKERGMRFRYECEGRSAGSILGASSGDSNKTLPAIELQGPIQNIKKVMVTVSLVTKDYPYRPHPHCLVGKDCADGTGICVICLNPHSNRRHSFANLGIQCVRRKELDASLEKRRNQKIDPFKTGHSKSIEDMDMNVVRLCFQCELEWEDGKKDFLNPIVSNPVYDKKATTTSELKINRLNIIKGPCTGKTEIYMLCDKVQKDDIEIIFKRGSWEAKAEFAQTDVHRQIAIVFKTPSYQEQDVGEEVEVDVLLRRLSDHMDSDPVTFTYQPDNTDPYEVKRKRKIKSDIGFTERSCVAVQNMAAAEASTSQPFEPFTFSPAESQLVPEELHPPAQSGASTMGEIHYNDLQEDNFFNEDMSPDDINILSRILFSDTGLLGFGQELNSNFTPGVMDMNFNFNQGGSGQDLGYYNDLQFNQLVNENQASPMDLLPLLFRGSAPQDQGQCDNEGSDLAQVKTEGDL